MFGVFSKVGCYFKLCKVRGKIKDDWKSYFFYIVVIFIGFYIGFLIKF